MVLNNTLKIRWLILLLGLTCFATAFSLRKAISPAFLLRSETQKLQEKLLAKERHIHQLLDDSLKIAGLKELAKDSKKGKKFINEHREKGINLLIYRANRLEYWSSYRVLPPNIHRIKEGTTFQHLPNGYYELVTKTIEEHRFVFLITIKTNYSIENQYLRNEMWPDFIAKNTIDIANLGEQHTSEVFNSKHDYLFSVKLSNNYTNNTYNLLELWLWIIAVLCISSFVHLYCASWIKQGHPYRATLVLSGFFILLRLSDLKYFWFNHQFNLKVFDPSIYAESDLLPSLGDFFLNVVAFTWVAIFIYTYRKYFIGPRINKKPKFFALVCTAISVFMLAVMAWFADELFFGLVFNSKIQFNISNIIYLGWMSWLSIFILCLMWLNIFIAVNIFYDINRYMGAKAKQQLLVFGIMVLAYSLYKVFDQFTAYHLFYALILLAIVGLKYKNSLALMALCLLCMATLSTIRYIKFEDIKERNLRVSIASKLLFEDDPKVMNALALLEKEIKADSSVVSYFKQPLLMQTFGFHNYLTKKYLDGYLSRFDYKIGEYNAMEQSLKNAESPPLNRYQKLVRSGAIKIPQSNYFYRVNDTFGFQNYFALVPVIEKDNLLGTLAIELKSKPYDYNSYFPDLLIDRKFKSDDILKQYSIAFYKNNQLFSQSGRYIYSLSGDMFPGQVNRIEFQNEDLQNQDYSHLIFQPQSNKKIVISLEKMEYKVRLAILSFFFIVFTIFAIICWVLAWLVDTLLIKRSGLFQLNRYLSINANRILYKTRIQFSIILSVLCSLFIVGWTTFFYIKQEYQEGQNQQLREKLRQVQNAYEKQLQLEGLSNSTEAQADFNQFADMNGTYLSLFNRDGDLFLTSLPTLYDSGIIAKKMAPMAYMELSLQKKSEYINPNEKIGDFNYAAAYAPLQNANKQLIGFISVPYYAVETDYQEKISPFINTLINIYALVFMLIGVLAVFLANQITSPLTFIQENISRTKLGQINKPIKWSRQDEIGSLIREYNKMISKLELSANKLARSERESAWREMAKQVAHEIKNPLTPLKLGLQLLKRSWKEQDPDFPQKFEKFSRSFIEQIDSLSNIASEFSNFAKMPDTKLEKIDLVSTIRQARATFEHTENVNISINNFCTLDSTIFADKDQMLRCFNNLFKNAIEATAESKPCQIRVKIENDESQLYVELEDNGVGIEPAAQQDIFRPNFTTKSSGTGLGLAFVKQAVENADGHIKLSSEVGQGTTFFLIFPLV